MVVAIDGVAATGKSTTARLAAKRLGYRYLDTGAIYRAVTWALLDRGIPLDRPDLVARAVSDLKIDILYSNGSAQIIVDGSDVSNEIRTPEISTHTMAVSEIKEVRAFLLPEQRRAASGGRIVVDGRDIGTVVLPGADLKFYFTASLEERTRRRFRELKTLGVEATAEDVRRSIEERDRRDMDREASPLYKAEGAIEVETTDLTVEEQVRLIVRAAEEAARRKLRHAMDEEPADA